MNVFGQDLRYGLRVLWKSPGFSLVAVIALALGIGANTAIFSVVNTVLLRPLPYDHPERLVKFQSINPKRGVTGSSFSYPNFADLRSQSNSLQAMAAYDSTTATLTGEHSPEQISGIESSADIFNVLEVKPALGRPFLAEDELHGGMPVVILSNGMWQRRFGGDKDIIGHEIKLSGKARTVIGVLPADFQFQLVNDPPEFWVPLDSKGEMEQQRGAQYLEVIGRLKPTATLQQATSELRDIATRLEQEYLTENAGRTVDLISAQDDLVGSLRPTLLVLLSAVGFVLLIACANVANLLLARATKRGREIAVRAAIGASRGRIVRQLLTESCVLSMFGGALGLLFAMWGVDLISSFVPANIPRVKESGLDLAVLGFTLGTAVLTGLVFGVAPALQASKIDLNEALKEGGRSSSEGRGRHRLRNLLIVSEVALSLVLLAGAGLMIRSFFKLRNTNPGFDAHNVLTASLSLPSVKYSKDEQIASFYGKAIENLSHLPGVEAAAAIMPLPLNNVEMRTTFAIGGEPDPDPGHEPVAGARVITPDYFRAMGIPIIKGRPFTERDTADAPKAIIVNESLVRRFFPGQDAIGRRLKLGLNDIDGEIVGIIGDVHGRGLDKPPVPEYYVPHSQVPMDSMSVVVRTTAKDPTTLLPPLTSAVQQIDKDLPLFQVNTVEKLVVDSMARQRFSMTLLGLFAFLAMALAMVGIFSVMSFLVAQRTHEFGIRMALGAQTKDILGLVVRQGMVLVAIGVVIGLAASLAVTRVMSSMLFGVGAKDPVTLIVVSLVLGFVALIACLVPARRATRVDPVIALRYE